MNCDRNRLDDFLAGDLSKVDAILVEEHLQQCDACREAVDQQRWIDDLLQSPIRTQLEQVPVHLAKWGPTPLSPRRRIVRLAACGLAAAATLLVAFGWRQLNRQPDSGTDRNVNQNVAAANLHPHVTSPLTATFVGGSNVIAVPIESHHPDVTIVRIYPTYRPQGDSQLATAQPNAATDSNWYDYSNGG